MLNSIKYGTTTINFTVNRADRKTLAIEVHPGLDVKVIAPENASLEMIKDKVLKRAFWIVKQQDFFKSFLPHTPEREYVSGETHYYLGRRYVLKIRESDKEQVKLYGGNLWIFIKADRKEDKEKVKSLLGLWYKRHAEKKFRERVELIVHEFRHFKIKKPEIEIKRMKTRWGSCNSNGKIILNPELIKSPVKCIDYVIYHELCHLIHPNHSTAFYNLQSKMNPGWEKWKKLLNEMMA